MIDVNVIVEEKDLAEFRAMFNSWNFFATYSTKSHTSLNDKRRWFYIVRTTSESYLYLRLKYGNDNVWIR